MDAPRPKATGDLRKTPFPEVLAYCLDKGLSGSLVIEAKPFPRTVLFLLEGHVVKVRVGVDVLRIGVILAELGKLHRETVESVAEQAKRQGCLLGEQMVAEGLVEEGLVERAVQAQLTRHIQWVAKLDCEAIYAFFENVDVLGEWGTDLSGTEPLAQIWQATQAAGSVERMRAVVERSVSGEIRLHPDARVQRFGFTANDRAVLDVLRVKPQTLEALVAVGLLEEERLFRVLYVLVLTRHLFLGEEKSPLGVVVGDSRVPRVRKTASRYLPRRRPEPKGTAGPVSTPMAEGRYNAFQEEIRSTDAQLDKLSYYQLLGVEPNVDTAGIRRAFFALARKWHPDRLPLDLDGEVVAATRIFARMSEAHKVLCSNEQRAEYDRLMGAEGGSNDEHDTVQRVLRAATCFQKAEILLKKGDYQGAERLAERAYEDDSDQAEYGALFAYVSALNRSAHGETQFEDLVGLLDRVAVQQKENMRIHYYRAVVLKLSGNHKGARRAFRYVAENDPHNVGAQRELRLYKMRGEDVEDDKSSKAGKGKGAKGKDTKSKDAKGKDGKGAARPPSFLGRLFNKS